MTEPAEIIHFLNDEIQGAKSRAGGSPNAAQAAKIEKLAAARDYIISAERALSNRRASA